MQNSVFESLDTYPELLPVQQNWQTIREEAIASLSHTIEICDSRVRPNMWEVLPLMPEVEDREVIPKSVVQKSRQLAPKTVQLVECLPNIHAYAFSILKPGGHIRLHQHENPFVTATLCLQTDGHSYIKVAQECQDFREGEFIIFDYRLLHEVLNDAKGDRIVLLILLDKKNGYS